MAATPKIGIKCILYRNTNSYATPTWVAVTLVEDLKVKYQWKAGKSLTRDTRVELAMKTGLELGYTATLRKDPGDAGYLALDDLAATDGTVDLLMLDGTNTTNLSRGFRFDAQIFQANESQGADEIVRVDFDIMPTVTDNKPQRAVVTLGAPVYTAL